MLLTGRQKKHTAMHDYVINIENHALTLSNYEDGVMVVTVALTIVIVVFVAGVVCTVLLIVWFLKGIKIWRLLVCVK